MSYTRQQANIFYINRLNLTWVNRLLCLLGCCMAFTCLPAQKITAALDREKILLGEQVILQLKLEELNPAAASCAAWFNLADTANHMEVVKREPIDTVNLNGSITYVQRVTITSFDSGKWLLPALQVSVEDKKTGKQTILTATPLSLEVLPVDISNLKNYHDIKDIIEVKPDESRNIYLLAGAALLTIVLVVLIVWLIKRRKKKPARIKPVLNVSAFEQAMKELEKVARENIQPAQALYTRLDHIYRSYFDAQLDIYSMQCTSDEMMLRLQVSLQQEEIRTRFFQLVRLIDAVKFARYTPAENYKAEAIDTISQTVQLIHSQMQQAIQHHA